MIFPYRFRVIPERLPVLTFALIVANVAAFLGTAHGLTVTEASVERFALTHSNASLSRMLSSSFLHGDVLHLAGNMWMLFLVGRAAEARLGYPRFLAVYFLGDLAGSLLHLAVTAGQPDVPTLGASGAVMAVLGASLWLFPFSRVSVFYWLSVWFVGTWEWRVWGVGLYYLGFDLLSGLTSLGEPGGVANFAHLGGAAGGALVAALLRGRRDTAVAGEAQSVLEETGGDFRVLTRAQIRGLAEGSDDYRVSLAALAQDVREGRPPDASQLRAFVERFRPMAEQEHPGAYAALVEQLAAQPGGPLPAWVLIETGSRLARAHEYQRAARLFERALGHGAASDAEADEAWYRLAATREMAAATRPEALRLYEEHARRWPFSPFGAQVQAALHRLHA
jgi:membrane associated rhomboid family serine protease